MKRYWTVMLGLLFVVTNLTAVSATELLIPVDYKTAKKITEYNGNAIRIPLFFSKRYKIVKIDESLLLDEDRKAPFTLSLFDGEKLTIYPQELKRHNSRRVSWIGGIHYPLLSEKIAREKRISPDHESVINELTTLTLGLFSWDVNRASGEVMLGSAVGNTANTLSTINQEQLTTGDNATADIDIEQHAFITVRGSFTSLRNNKEYRIENLKFTPRYHIVFETDQDKVPHGRNEIPSERVAQKEQLLLDPDKGDLFRSLVESGKKNEEKILELEKFLDGLEKDNENKKIMEEI